MLLSAEKFSPPISSSGLRSLLAAPHGGGVVTRAIASPSSRVSGAAGVRDGTSFGGDAENVKADEEDVEAEEEGNVQDEENGCWVSYGRREPRRRLPPPSPSRGALRRTRTGDGRLVIRIVPVVWRECIRARRRGGRLTMQLVESPLTPRPLPAPIGIRALEELDDDVTASTPDDDKAALVPAIGSSEAVDHVEEATVAPQEMLPVPRVPSAGCFEDVFKYGSMGGSALNQMPSLRMVH